MNLLKQELDMDQEKSKKRLVSLRLKLKGTRKILKTIFCDVKSLLLETTATRVLDSSFEEKRGIKRKLFLFDKVMIWTSDDLSIKGCIECEQSQVFDRDENILEIYNPMKRNLIFEFPDRDTKDNWKFVLNNLDKIVKKNDKKKDSLNRFLNASTETNFLDHSEDSSSSVGCWNNSSSDENIVNIPKKAVVLVPAPKSSNTVDKLEMDLVIAVHKLEKISRSDLATFKKAIFKNIILKKVLEAVTIALGTKPAIPNRRRSSEDIFWKPAQDLLKNPSFIPIIIGFTKKRLPLSYERIKVLQPYIFNPLMKRNEIKRISGLGYYLWNWVDAFYQLQVYEQSEEISKMEKEEEACRIEKKAKNKRSFRSKSIIRDKSRKGKNKSRVDENTKQKVIKAKVIEECGVDEESDLDEHVEIQALEAMPTDIFNNIITKSYNYKKRNETPSDELEFWTDIASHKLTESLKKKFYNLSFNTKGYDVASVTSSILADDEFELESVQSWNSINSAASPSKNSDIDKISRSKLGDSRN